MTVRRGLVLLLLIVVTALNVQAHRRNPHDLGPVQRFVLKISYPVEWAGSQIGRGFSGVGAGVGQLFTARRHVKALEWRLESAEDNWLRAQLLEHENAQLRALLELAPTLPATTVTGRVLSRSRGGGSRTLHIDRGSSDGVQEGQVVLGSFGVVGRVVHVQSKMAIVLVITDERSSFPVRVGAAAVLALAAGDGDRGLVITGVPKSFGEDLPAGSPLWTSGDDGLTPAGLGVAEIVQSQIVPERLDLEIKARPLQDPSKVTIVQVVVGP